MRERVLVVEDDPSIRELLTFHLERAGMTVRALASAREALETVRTWRPEVVLLDLMLPDGSGLELCRQIREGGPEGWPLPGLIMVTALDEESDRVVGLEMGADDYITKPFSPRELVARVRAVLRRRQGPGEAAGAPPRRIGALSIDPERLRVTVGDRPVEALTPTEFRILAALFDAGGRVLSRQQLIDRVWGADFYGDLRTVDVHIRHIREKLGRSGAGEVVETVRGFGYRLAADGG
jgi:DNA-binding response OmpR family regulator